MPRSRARQAVGAWRRRSRLSPRLQHAPRPVGAMAAPGGDGAAAGPMCRASSSTLIRVTAKTAGPEAARPPFRRAALAGAGGAGGRRVTASGKKPESTTHADAVRSRLSGARQLAVAQPAPREYLFRRCESNAFARSVMLELTALKRIHPAPVQVPSSRLIRVPRRPVLRLPGPTPAARRSSHGRRRTRRPSRCFVGSHAVTVPVGLSGGLSLRP